MGSFGEGCDGVSFDQSKGIIFTSNVDGAAIVIKQESENIYKLVETIPTQKKIRTIVLNRTTSEMYLPVTEYGETHPVNKENMHPSPVIKPNTFSVLMLR